MNERYKGDESKKDIHESNIGYQKQCYDAVMYAKEKLNWFTVPLTQNGEMRSMEENRALIWQTVEKSGVLD